MGIVFVELLRVCALCVHSFLLSFFMLFRPVFGHFCLLFIICFLVGGYFFVFMVAQNQPVLAVVFMPEGFFEGLSFRVLLVCFFAFCDCFQRNLFVVFEYMVELKNKNGLDLIVRCTKRGHLIGFNFLDCFVM